MNTFDKRVSDSYRVIHTDVNDNDENIEDEAVDGSVVTLDSMRRQI